MSTVPKKLSKKGKSVQSSFLATTLITAQCHSIMNTVFTTPTVKPKWFDSLNSKLDDAKTVAKEWIDNLAPEISASIPAQVIDYGATFNASIDAIHTLYKQDPTASGKTNPTVQQASAIMKNLSSAVNSKIEDVTSMQTKLKTWGVSLQKAHDALTTGAGDIQKTIVDLQTDISKMNNAITNNRNAINSLNEQIMACEIAVGVGIFMLVAGVALCIATAGAAAIVAGGVAAVGAAAIIGGGVTWAILQGKIDDDYASIAAEQKEKSDDQQQIVALQGLASGSDGANSAMTLSLSALSTLETTWALYGKELAGVVDKLDKGASMSSIIMEDVMSSAAQNEWNDVVELAKDLSSAQIPVENKQLAIKAA